MAKSLTLKRVLHYLPAIILTLAAPIFTPVFLFAQNAAEVYFKDLLVPIFTFVLIAIITFGIAFLVTKSIYKAAITSTIFSVLFCNFTLCLHAVQIIAPFIKLPHFAVIIVFVYIALIILLSHINAAPFLGVIVRIICIAICSIIIFNTFSAIFIKLQASQRSFSDYYVAPTKSLPNIYYIIADEYTDFELLKQYGNYNNDDFKTFLQSKSFTVSSSSENNYPNTATVLTGILCLDYMPPADDSLLEYEQKRKNAPTLYTTLSARGYTLRGLGEWDFLGLPPALGSEIRREASTKEGTTFTQMLWERTPISWQSPYENDRDLILKSFGFFTEDKNYAPANTFTMMHLNCPHLPIIFNADGSPTDRITQTAYRYSTSAKPYLAQLEFITSQLKNTVNEIIARDADSIIIIQSDHSARDFYNLGIPEKDWVKILNAVYYRGQPLPEIEGQSAVNTVITILNKLLNTQTPYAKLTLQNTVKN